jgi:hypothetical protein
MKRFLLWSVLVLVLVVLAAPGLVARGAAGALRPFTTRKEGTPCSTPAA